ncbi:hypothetical protein [Nocardia sp. XZ_19_369]|uniref:hypothetical protein n=1 Tax=Nocardia sp. XZ_19_369 TaxID=2769487 RepID=UPI0018908EF8|nr:hypothetical protein [Nocardia sp. XZ_19_369]
MALSRNIAALAMVLAAAAAPLAVGSQAAAESMNASCGGGTVYYDTDPIGFQSMPINAGVRGNLSGCQGTPTHDATIDAQFTGAASCMDINGQVDGTVTWSNGEVSAVSGPFHVPGGFGAPATNTLTIESGPGAGGQIVMDLGPVNGATLAVACAMGQAQHGELPILGLRIV